MVGWPGLLKVAYLLILRRGRRGLPDELVEESGRGRLGSVVAGEGQDGALLAGWVA
jgi:hypothetical protein